MYSTREQAYRFHFMPAHMDKLKVQPYLYDRHLQTYKSIAMDANSSVNFTIDSDPSSKAVDRFEIVFKQVQRKIILITHLQAGRKADRTIDVNWKVENEADVKQYEIERSADGIFFTGIITVSATGNNNTTIAYSQTDLGPLGTVNYYRIKGIQNDGTILYSEIVKVAALPDPSIAEVSEIRIYPNPVTAKRMQLVFRNKPAGKYQVQLVNQLGQVLLSKSLVIHDNLQSQALELGSSVLAGQYQLNIVEPGGSKTEHKLFVE
jgi:hypothetical protein